MQINIRGVFCIFIIAILLMYLNSYKLHVIEVLINFTIYLLNYYKAI